ncbi:hypothetical protein RHODGE_RHODGE_02853 [Rhodoplanes serenus]|uniref:Uncharacterized protein n=1 Tax=Rhodoplanes serenus TaxID=200615 RepID=A0A3S4B206_9BRAD|nr:hypothetical protein [Rhodoplanes serenus]VCU09684.1 hypothetical protein RHODGE_RHODGE_02853 [Rhodoplanes serenus]
MTATYTVTTTFGSFRFSADLTQASAPIYDEDGTATPYRTADARHSADHAAVLLLGYYGRDYWLSPDVILSEDEDGNQLFDGLRERPYLFSLIVSVEADPGERD